MQRLLKIVTVHNSLFYKHVFFGQIFVLVVGADILVLQVYYFLRSC